MFAHEIMTRDVITINDDATMQDAIRRLAEYHISGLPVVDATKRLVGVITEADVLAHPAVNPDTTSVRAIMTQPVITVTAMTTTDDVREEIIRRRIKRVFVVNGPYIIGVISREDLVRVLASRWTCDVCGAIHLGPMPEICDACGAAGYHISRQTETRLELFVRQ
jgi:CBS domain-containing protein